LGTPAYLQYTTAFAGAAFAGAALASTTATLSTPIAVEIIFMFGFPLPARTRFATDA